MRNYGRIIPLICGYKIHYPAESKPFGKFGRAVELLSLSARNYFLRSFQTQCKVIENQDSVLKMAPKGLSYSTIIILNDGETDGC